MVETIAEVVDVISDDGVLAVIESTQVSALTCSRKVSLQSRSASVQDTESVSVISPCISEGLLELL